MSPEAKEKMWKVKAEDGSVFGPASMATLLAWARDGRLAASHVISTDGKAWTPVASHPELAMNWIAEGVNVAGQGAFLLGAVLTHKAGLAQLTLRGKEKE